MEQTTNVTNACSSSNRSIFHASTPFKRCWVLSGGTISFVQNLIYGMMSVFDLVHFSAFGVESGISSASACGF